MGTLLRPAVSEVRSLLQRIKLENIEKGISLAAVKRTNQSAGNHTNWELLNELQPISQFETFHSECQIGSNFTKNFKVFGGALNLHEFLSRCRDKLVGLPPPLDRKWKHSCETERNEANKDGQKLRLFQWNVLSQTLGTKNDNFSKCAPSALEWSTRCYRMLQEIGQHDPDIICLQEVDHFPFLLRSLASLGYVGRFAPKPDSPCIHIQGNSGPDGCAIFYKREKFDLQNLNFKVLEIWGVQSNQIVLSMMLKSKSSEEMFVVATTHLKARKGDLMSQLRYEQGNDLITHLKTISCGRPVICTGDFNADPTEPVYSLMTQENDLKLQSAYASVFGGEEPEYTSWKFRGEVEHKETLDYIFCSKDQFEVQSVLQPVPSDDVTPDRFPNLAFASDHLSLVADLNLIPPRSRT